MTTLEKILQDIEDKAVLGKKKENGFVIMEYVRDIFEKYISCENNTETTKYPRDNDGMISIEDDRLWNILFEEACVEGQQAERIHNRLKEICPASYKPPVESVYDKNVKCNEINSPNNKKYDSWCEKMIEEEFKAYSNCKR